MKNLSEDLKTQVPPNWKPKDFRSIVLILFDWYLRSRSDFRGIVDPEVLAEWDELSTLAPEGFPTEFTHGPVWLYWRFATTARGAPGDTLLFLLNNIVKEIMAVRTCEDCRQCKSVPPILRWDSGETHLILFCDSCDARWELSGGKSQRKPGGFPTIEAIIAAGGKLIDECVSFDSSV